MLEGEVFDTCWLLSPDYEQGFRPAIGTEVGLDQIAGWHVLKLTWNPDRSVSGPREFDLSGSGDPDRSGPGLRKGAVL